MTERPTERPRLLILGGTGEAVALAEALAGRAEVTYSLAGRTDAPRLPPGVAVRSGGFGGAAALADWTEAARIDAVVDATHPFAAAIAGNAEVACRRTGTPRLKLLRPAWEARTGDIWHAADSIADAARLISETGGNVFLAVGRQQLGAFTDAAAGSGRQFLIRTVDPLPAAPFAGAVCLTGRSPFSVQEEAALLRDHAIGCVVSRNAGGASSYAKIAAARSVSVPVIMIDRPPPPPGECVADVAGALDWLRELLR